MASERHHEEQDELIRGAYEDMPSVVSEKKGPKSTKLTSTLSHAFVIGTIEFQAGETKVIEGKPIASLKKWIDRGVLKVE